MNTPSDELFQIVKSLTTQEKRLFKRFSQENSRHSVYVQLFDAIDSLKEYDEDKIIKLLNRRDAISTIPKMKNYLLEVLFDFLEYYHFDSSIDIKLQKLLHRVEILFSKRLFSSAKKFLKKVEKTAMENHRHLVLLNILGWDERIMLAEGNNKYFIKYGKEKHLKELYYLNLYKNTCEYHQLKLQVLDCFKSDTKNISKSSRIVLNRLVKHDLLKSENKALSLPAKYYYCYVLGIAHLLLNNHSLSYKYFKSSLEYVDDAKIVPSEKLSLLSNFIILLHHIKRGDEIEKLKGHIDQLMETVPEKLQTKNFRAMYLSAMNNYIDYHLSVFDVKKALAASDEIQREIEKHISPNRFLVYYANRFLIYFLLGDYRQALRCINRALSIETRVVMKNLFMELELLLIVTHYELGNREMPANICRSYSRKYSEELKENKMANLIITFFSKPIHSNSIEKKAIFKQLRRQIELLSIKNRFSQFDFMSWAESKIENRRFLDIVKEKAGEIGISQ